MNNLMRAVVAKDIATVEKLLSEGADPNYVGNWNSTPLYYATETENLEIVKLLIDAGANACDPRSMALYYAICRANIPLIKLLVENGAYFALHDGLITAINEKNLKIIHELIKLGADVNRPNSGSEFPIMFAIGLRNCEILKLLSENGGDLNMADACGDTPLITSVRSVNFPIAKYLIEKRVDLNRKNNKNETALSISLDKDDFRTFQLLIESGADPKLASAAIENKIKTNSNLAAYMSKVQKANLKNSDEYSGQEAAI